MRMQSRHLTFIVDKDPEETTELHKTRAFAIAALLDEHPGYIKHLDKVIQESKNQ